MITRRMTDARWQLLDAFEWREDAIRLWERMTHKERRAVYDASSAEAAANAAYLKADRAVTRARRRLGGAR